VTVRSNGSVIPPETGVPATQVDGATQVSGRGMVKVPRNGRVIETLVAHATATCLARRALGLPSAPAANIATMVAMASLKDISDGLYKGLW